MTEIERTSAGFQMVIGAKRCYTFPVAGRARCRTGPAMRWLDRLTKDELVGWLPIAGMFTAFGFVLGCFEAHSYLDLFLYVLSALTLFITFFGVGWLGSMLND
jgi:hypothetical protein